MTAPVPTTAGNPCIGLVTPYDFALDRELWRWVPDTLDLLLTRTPYEPLAVTVEMAQRVGDPGVVAEATLALTTPAPAVVGYACTSGSFVAGLAGERALVDAMLATGVPVAVTTSGAVVSALRALGAERVAVATPYDEAITALLVAFLAEAGVAVTHAHHLGLDSAIWTVPRDVTLELVRRAWTEDCDAVFVSCTNLATYDVIPALEEELGVPVISANQATMWAAVSLAGLTAQGEGQRLLQEGYRP